MMSYEEATAEIKRRRDSELQRRKNNRKKLAISLCAFVLCMSVGAGAWMISGGNEPTGTTDIPIDLPDWTPAPYDPEAEHELYPDSVQCTYPPVIVTELMDTDEKCEVTVDTLLPENLPVYVTTDRCGVPSENYLPMAREEIIRFAKILYGEEYDESKLGGDSYFPDDLYIELNPNGEPLMKANVEWVRVPLEITRVEEYRDMSYREALEYVTSNRYYKAIVEYLGFEEVSHSGYARTDIYDQNKYMYRFIFASPKTDFTDGMMKMTDKYISVEMTFVRTEDGGKITIEYNGCHPMSEDTDRLEKKVECKTVTVSDAIERAKAEYEEGYYNPEINIDEVHVYIHYGHASLSKWNTPDCIVPYYEIYFGLKEPVAGCSLSRKISVTAVDGIDDYLEGK